MTPRTAAARRGLLLIVQRTVGCIRFLRRLSLLAAVSAAFGISISVQAAEPDAVTVLDALQVTATRTPEPVSTVPAAVSIVDGRELRARGVNDLRGALALVAGVEAPPGGDAGPAGAVPSFWGLHEFDAFLLVVDGVPWGGAFNPSIPTLDLNNVERIEVLRGAAPVIYGATAFVGVIQVIHYAAGEAADRVELGYGSYGTLRGSASTALPAIGSFKQSLAISGERQQFSDAREDINNGKALYRGAMPLAGGQLRLDADLTSQHTVPNSPTVREGEALTTATRADDNLNPADAHIDEHRYHLVLGYSRPTTLGLWDSTASYSHSNVRDRRGFLRVDMTPDEAATNADYQDQDRGVIDSYFDTHFGKHLFDQLDVVYGADLLYGSGKQQSTNGAYFAELRGTTPPATSTRPVDEINGVDDRRAFIGQYLQADWKPSARWDVLAGLRLNETKERKTSTHIDTADATADIDAYDRRNKTRLSGMLGASYVAWTAGADQAVVFADYRNTFKPAAIDFGPDVTPEVLNPETARSYEAGVKGRLLDGRLDYDLDFFFLHFNNLVVATTDADGNPQMQNAGSELFRGVEMETRYHFSSTLAVAANYSYHNARFGPYAETDADGNTQSLDGKQLELSPHSLASLGVLYTPAQGFNASAIGNYVGRRYLDRANTAPTGSYVTADASLGYRWHRYGASLYGNNLSNRRPPVTESEFGDRSYYLLPARSFLFALSADL
ncbi:MAG: TonB-dependent receptor [Nevskia sp.]|nr:TonB-dependent receptor [Nevskia sp.]